MTKGTYMPLFTSTATLEQIGVHAGNGARPARCSIEFNAAMLVD